MTPADLARQTAVLIPAFNAERTLARALASVAAQGMAVAQVIVADDGSSDGTAALAEAHGARVVRLPRNGGVSAATNAAVDAAAEPLIAFLDADDEWLPGKLNRQLPLVADPAVAFSFTGHIEIDPATGAIVAEAGNAPLPHPPAELWRALLRRSIIAKPTVIARRDALLRAGLFDPRMAVAGDQDMWLRLAQSGPVAQLPEPLTRVWNEPTSLTYRYARNDLAFVIPMIERALARAGDRLSEAERRAVLARRWAAAAQNLAGAGDWALALGAELKARQLGGGDPRNWQRILASVPLVKRLRGRG
ncbi:MAG: glycosyltransferase family A protein [Sphingomonadaceae bacterium]|nr:glycosyltransferase family A protein [Sphingomonadaceae bacterium]